MAKINNYILVCGGTGCRASRSEEIIAALRRALDRTGESERTRVIRTGCFGFCEQGPIVKMIPDNTFYVSVKPEDAEDAAKPLRKSHENPDIQALYEEFLGEPCGPLSHELLHTRYYDRKPVVEPKK